MRCAGCPKPNRSLSSAVRHLLRLELHALLHVLGFAVLVLPHALVILLSLAPLPLAVSFACLWCFLGNLLHDWHTPDQIQHRMLDGNMQVLSTTWSSRRICCRRSTGLCLSMSTYDFRSPSLSIST